MQRCITPIGSVSSHDNSLPYAPSDSPGSSVSTRLKDEYDELLKYAVVVPTYDPGQMPQSLTDFRNSFPRANPHPADEHACAQQEDHEEEDDSGTEVGDGLSQTGDATDGARHPDPICHTTPPRRQPCPPQDHPQHTAADMELLMERPFRPVPPENLDTQSEVSVSSSHDELHGAYAFSMTVDKDVARMEGLMSTWLGDLNRNVLAEFGQSKIRMLEHYKHLLQKEKERHAADMNRLKNETEGLKELLLTYEQSIERKDEVISNLTRAMQRQCDKFEMAKTFCEWKIRHNDKKREAFATNLANRHYQRILAQKVWDAWHGLVESRWRQRVERACQAKAQEVCMTLTNDYETRLASLNEALDSARTEVTRLHAERDKYEETMKKAFMRGVCALNLEAMTMFQGDEEGDGDHPPEADSGVSGAMSGGEPMSIPSGMTMTSGLPMTVGHEPMYMSEPHGAPSPRIVTSTGATSSRSTLSQASSTRSLTSVSSRTKAGQKGKVISAKLSARTDGISRSGVGSNNMTMGLAPPMSSVIVERHQPVTKATIGKATANQFPQAGQGAPSIVQRRIAGQHKQVPLATPNIQTIKLVE